MTDLSFSWYFVYLLTLFLFDISPGVTFVTTANNTIKNRSLLSGIFTSLGAATSDGISALIGFFFCATLEKYTTMFKGAQLIGMAVLFYFAIRMLLSKPQTYSFDGVKQSRTNWLSYKSGFVITFTNIGIATVIISVISQFYKYVNGGAGYCLLLFSVPVMSFLSFFLVACGVYFLKLWKLFGKYAWVVDKIAGIVLIVFGILNVIEILNS